MSDTRRGDAPNVRPDPKKLEHEPPRRKAPVFVYLAVLFIAAFLMLLLAYFIQERNEEVAAPVSRETLENYKPTANNDRIFTIIP